MKREIKFRVWDNDQVKYYHFDLLNTLQIPMIVSFGAPVQQFTGLLDKNGKEIYEGDIVKTKFQKHNESPLQLTQKIVYDSTLGAFALVTTDENTKQEYEVSYNYCPVHWQYEIEIIGNIYESPELINNPKPQPHDQRTSR